MPDTVRTNRRLRSVFVPKNLIDFLKTSKKEHLRYNTSENSCNKKSLVLTQKLTASPGFLSL